MIAFLGVREARVPVIVCSAAGPSALKGFDPRVVKAIVRKPFDIDQLVAAVSSAAEDPRHDVMLP